MPQAGIKELKAGDQITPLHAGPITRANLALFAGASGDHNPIHIDLDFAREAGMGDVFAHGMLSMAYLGRLLTNSFPQTALRKFSVRFVAIVHIHDRLTCTGTVTELFEEDGEKRMRLQLQVANEEAEAKVKGEAVVGLI
jgi:acyl dehydratase